MDYWDLINDGIAMLLSGLVGLVLWYLRQWLASKITTEQGEHVAFVAALAVKAAEQYGGDAEDKKRQALAIAGHWLAVNNIKIDLSQIDAAIESAVMNEFNFFKSDMGLPASDDVVSGDV